MRLSEKTIELNFCAQFTKRCSQFVFWFGLTQKQEARSGFDACTKLGGRLLIFQFKASNRTLSSGKQQFRINHDQMTKLRARVGSFQRSVFYVFPLLGTTLDLHRSRDVFSESWFLDVATLPNLMPPTKRDGTLRKDRTHYADVVPGMVTLHSDPIDILLLSATEYVDSNFTGADGFNWAFESFEDFWEFRQFLGHNSLATVLI